MEPGRYFVAAAVTGVGLLCGGLVGWGVFALSPIGPEAIGFMPTVTFWAEAAFWVILAAIAPRLLSSGDYRLPYFAFGAVFALLGPAVPWTGVFFDFLMSPFGSLRPSAEWAWTRFILVVSLYAVARAVVCLLVARKLVHR